jgi:hypothetical protein
MHTNPPMPFMKAFVQAMVQVHNNWLTYANKLTEPFSLKMLVFEQNFLNSEVVVATGDQVNHNEPYFVPHEVNKPFPHERYQSDNNDTHNFKWTYCKHMGLLDESELNFLPAKTRRKLIESNRVTPTKLKISFETDQPVYDYYQEDCWVGERI